MDALLETGYPNDLERFAGKIMDVDAHEWMPPDLWAEEFGEITRPFAEADAQHLKGMKRNYFKDSDTETTNVINARTVWHTKGPYAPAAYDMRRRLDVMDFVGVERQLIFPGNLVINACFLLGQADNLEFFPSIAGDRRAYAMQMIKAHNDWVVRQQRWSSRLRPVATLVAATVDELYAEAKRLFEAGVRAIWLPSSILPGGRSPAHNDLDPFWALCADSDTVVTLHVGNEAGFFATLEWKNAAQFEGWRIGEEISLDPWTLATWPMPGQNFASTVIVGGVFHRHPKLRFGIIELGGHWIGPLSLALDMWATNTQTTKWSEKLPLLPSEYIKRNIRVSAFPWENVDVYVDHYGLTDVYAYASDFPHVEGGFDPMGFWSKRLERFGPEMMEKFFITNGQFLLPD